MRVELETTARGIPPSDAIAWWTDFHDGDKDHPFLKGTHRRIAKREGDSFELIERVRFLGLPIFQERSEGVVDGHIVCFEGENTFATFVGKYLFVQVAAGTMVRLEADVELKSVLAWTTPLSKRIVKDLLRKDLDGHIREMEADLGAK